MNSVESMILESPVKPSLGCIGLTEDSRTIDFGLGLMVGNIIIVVQTQDVIVIDS